MTARHRARHWPMMRKLKRKLSWSNGAAAPRHHCSSTLGIGRQNVLSLAARADRYHIPEGRRLKFNVSFRV